MVLPLELTVLIASKEKPLRLRHRVVVTAQRAIGKRGKLLA